MGRGNSLSDPGLSVSESLSRWGTLRSVCCLLGWSSRPLCLGSPRGLPLPGDLLSGWDFVFLSWDWCLELHVR